MRAVKLRCSVTGGSQSKGAVRCGAPSRENTEAENRVVSIKNHKQFDGRQRVPVKREERKKEIFNMPLCHPKYVGKCILSSRSSVNLLKNKCHKIMD